MKKRVLRYHFPASLDTNKEFSINMPKGAEIVKIAIKPFESNASIWALVSVDETDIETRKFVILGTGHLYEIDRCKFNNKGILKFVDTIFESRDDNPDDCWVWHIFEIL